MRGSKFQAPTSREIPNAKPQGRIAVPHWSFKLGASLALGCWCLVFRAVSAALGRYSIDWSTIGGGSGTSTGGVYRVSGPIGQPDAGAMSGVNYSLTGGFWSLLSVVQTPVRRCWPFRSPAPTLRWFPGRRLPPASRFNTTPTACVVELELLRHHAIGCRRSQESRCGLDGCALAVNYGSTFTAAIPADILLAFPGWIRCH